MLVWRRVSILQNAKCSLALRVHIYCPTDSRYLFLAPPPPPPATDKMDPGNRWHSEHPPLYHYEGAALVAHANSTLALPPCCPHQSLNSLTEQNPRHLFSGWTSGRALPRLPPSSLNTSNPGLHAQTATRTYQWIAHWSTLGHRQLPGPQGEGITNPNPV